MLKVSASNAPYLALQRGGASDYAHDLKKFAAVYNQTLWEDLETLWPVLPARFNKLFDIGSGLGGIDILLQQRYGCYVHLLDGTADMPKRKGKAVTYSNEAVTREFWRANKAQLTAYHDPATCKPFPCDVVLSLYSWCFHYPPAAYIDLVRACCHKDTVLIIDLRRNRQDWLEELSEHFKMLWPLWAREKFDRIAWVPR